MLRSLSLVAVFLLWFSAAMAETQSPSERVYAQASDSVFLLEVLSPKGEVTGTGTGFLVSPSEVLTNAHVADAGSLQVVTPSFRLPCEVQKTDTVSDLAVCRLAARSGAKPLALAQQQPKAGARVFVISNPRGFERTISEGLFTGPREVQGRSVVQISAPISPGSSGGPVLNEAGEVVAVAVSTLRSGQNVNFAVPLADLKRFLSTDHVSSGDIETLLASAKTLAEKREGLVFDDAPESEWQRTQKQQHDILMKVVASATEPAPLNSAYELADLRDFPVMVAAARKLASLPAGQNRETFSKLAFALYLVAEGKDAPELLEAEQAIGRAIQLGQSRVAADLNRLGDIQSQRENYIAALDSYLKGRAQAKSGSGELLDSTLGAFHSTYRLGRHADAELWIDRAKAIGVSAYQHAVFARYFDQRDKDKQAGDEYLEAFRLSPGSYSYVCSAGRSYGYADEVDSALAASRRCIELAASKDDANELVANAHQTIASKLITRNLFEESITHSKQAIRIRSGNASDHWVLAQALNGLRRYSEAIVSAKEALRLTDGKYAFIHEILGAAYFELNQFSDAAQSYQAAARLDVKDSDSAFNAGASLYNDKQYEDALFWLRESLRRAPTTDLRDRAQKLINAIQAR